MIPVYYRKPIPYQILADLVLPDRWCTSMHANLRSGTRERSRQIVNASVFIDSLRGLMRNIDRGLYLIPENGRGASLQEGRPVGGNAREAHQALLSGGLLPELNPDERPNQDVRPDADNGRREHDIGRWRRTSARTWAGATATRI